MSDVTTDRLHKQLDHRAEWRQRYMGMSYEQASREATRLVEEPCGWFRYFDRLEVLRAIMIRSA